MSSKRASETTLPGETQRPAYSSPEDPESMVDSMAPALDIAQNDKESKERDEQTSTGSDDAFQVTLEHDDDPKNLPVLRKWLILLVVCCGSLCATCASSMAASAEGGVSATFHVGKEVSILGVSLFVLGLGVGPLLVGPLSEVYGRNIVYRASYALFFAFSWPVAFAPHISVYLIFRFLTGFCSSAFLSVAGGSVGDLFDNHKIGTPMAVYTISPFIGPVLGPLLSGFINQNTTWRWTFRVLIVWTFATTIALFIVVPETYTPFILKCKAQRLRRETGDQRYWSPLDRREISMTQAIIRSCYVPFELLMLDSMALLLDLWSALLLGILYLTFQAFPIIFGQVHHFSMEFTGLTFVGMGIGMVIGVFLQPQFNKKIASIAKAHGGQAPPEARLIPGMFGAIMVPVSLYWLAFTTYPGVHWIVPIIASAPFAAGVLFCFNAVFTYTVIAYRPIAASAMAANTFVRTSFAAAFPLFAGQMYNRLGTVGATALLAGLTTIAAPLPFVFYRIGARLRAKSRFAATT